MSGQHNMNDSQLDEAIARFTDELLESGSSETIEMSTHTELYSLQETAALLQRSVGELQPPIEVASRIKSSLMDEWENSPFAQQSFADAKGAWWGKASTEQEVQPTKLRRSFWQMPSFGIMMASASVMILVFVFTLTSSGESTNNGSTTSGAAFGGPLYLAAASIFIGGIALYFLNRRNK